VEPFLSASLVFAFEPVPSGASPSNPIYVDTLQNRDRYARDDQRIVGLQIDAALCFQVTNNFMGNVIDLVHTRFLDCPARFDSA
jgi:hypothetical protein